MFEMYYLQACGTCGAALTTKAEIRAHKCPQTCGYPENGSWPVELGGWHTGAHGCPCDDEPRGEFKHEPIAVATPIRR